jgi:membrane fusion protein (multidrug efflux system)
MSRPTPTTLSPAQGPTADTPPPTGSKRPNRRSLAIAGAVCLAAAIGGGRWWWEATHHVSSNNATVAGHIHPVSGRLAGTVTEVLVTDNQLVKKGDLLIRLDPTDTELRVAQAQAALDAARKQASTAAATVLVTRENASAQATLASGNVDAATAALAAAQAATAQAEAGVSAAQAQQTQVTANLEKARNDYRRYAALVEEGGISQQQFDSAKAVLVAAEAGERQSLEGVRQARERVRQARQDVQRAMAQASGSRSSLQQAAASREQTEVSRNQHAAVLATVHQAEVALRDAETQQSYTRIVAPSDGRIGKRTAEVGQRIQPGQALMAIVSPETWVVANLKETQLAWVKPGAPVTVHLDAYPDRPLRGRVDSIAPASGAQFALLPPDNATGNFTKIVQRVPVKIVWEPDSLVGIGDRLVPGLSATVSIDIAGP